MPPSTPSPGPTRLAHAWLSPAEIKALQQARNRSGLLALGFDWSVILGALVLAGYSATLWAGAIAVLLIAGRQMGLAVLMHECAHRSLFRTRRWHDTLGQWLVAAPMNLPMAAYWQVHGRHHRHGGTTRDPDLVLVRGYPATPASLARKFGRDLAGLTGARDLLAQARRFTLERDFRFLVVHAVLLAGLSLAGIGWTYALWWLAYLSPYQLIFRLRLIGEHGTAVDRSDPDVRGHTTTVPASPLERLLLAPHGVSYHVEHHLLPGTPIYRLAQAHRLLKQRGCFSGHDCLRASYADVLRRAVAPDGRSRVPPVMASAAE